MRSLVVVFLLLVSASGFLVAFAAAMTGAFSDSNSLFAAGVGGMLIALALWMSALLIGAKL